MELLEPVEGTEEEVESDKARVIAAIQNMETEDFSDFYDKVKELMTDEGDEEEGVVICPDSKLDARNWVFAFVKMKEEIDFLKGDLIPALTEKYIKPSREKIEQLETAQGFVKSGLFEFLRQIGEKKVSFPELATVSEAKGQPKVIYPEDEGAFLAMLVEQDSDYIINKPSIDKKRILDEWKKTEELPFDELLGKAAGTNIRITVSKTRK